MQQRLSDVSVYENVNQLIALYCRIWQLAYEILVQTDCEVY